MSATSAHAGERVSEVIPLLYSRVVAGMLREVHVAQSVTLPGAGA